MATETEEFRVGSILGPEGLGGNGQKLLDAHDVINTPEARAVFLRRINADLDGEVRGVKGLEKVARFVGADIADAHVRGGGPDGEGAWITYVRVDGGQATKGYFPFKDLAGGSSDRHFSQRDALLGSEFAQGRPVTSEQPAQAQPADPFAALAEASASELIELMREHPERAEAVKAFERAVKGDKARKSVLEFEPEPEDGESGDPPAA